MATILEKITLGRTLALVTGANPTTGGGTVAPLGSLATVSDGSGLFVKSSVADAGWSPVIIQTGTMAAGYIGYWNDAKALTGSTNFIWDPTNHTFTTKANSSNIIHRIEADVAINTFAPSSAYTPNSIFESLIANTSEGGYEMYGIAKSTSTIPLSIIGLTSVTGAINNYPSVQIRGGKRSGADNTAVNLTGSDYLLGITPEVSGNTPSLQVMTLKADGTFQFGVGTNQIGGFGAIINNNNGGNYIEITNTDTGTSAYEGLYFVESGANIGIVRFNSNYSSNYSGTSLSLANGLRILNAPSTYKPIGLIGSPIFLAASGTSTDLCVRVDTIGLSVGLLSNVHNSNINAFQVNGKSFLGNAVTTATALLHIAAGSISAAPIRLTSGPLATGANILPGNIEFLTDGFYVTNTSGPTRQQIATDVNSMSLTNKKLGSLSTNGIIYTSGGDGTLNTSSSFQWNDTSKFLQIQDHVNGDADISIRAAGLTTNSFVFTAAGNFSDSILQGYIANTSAGGYEWWGFADSTANTVAFSFSGMFNNTGAINNFPCVQIRGGKRSGTSLTSLDGSDRLLHITNDPTGNSATGAANIFCVMGDGKTKVGDATAPARQLEVINSANPQLRLTQANASVFADLQVTSTGHLDLLVTNNGLTRIGTSTYGGLFVNPSVNTRDGGWNLGIELQANATNAFPAILFSNQTGATRFGGLIFTRSASGDTSTSQQAQVKGYESGNVGIIDFAANGNIGTTGPTNMLRLYGNIGIAVAGSFTPTAKIHIAAGVAAASGAPLKFTSGTNLTTGETGAMEYNGTNLFFTRTGTTRETINCSTDGAAAPATHNIGVILDYFGTSATRVLTTPDSWESVVIAGTTYKRPLYL